MNGLYSKAQIKLANKLTPATAGTTCGTFTPLLLAFKVTSDKLSGIHNQWSLKLNDLLREVLKYNDEQQKKHKQVRNLKIIFLCKNGRHNKCFKWYIHNVHEICGSIYGCPTDKYPTLISISDFSDCPIKKD